MTDLKPCPFCGCTEVYLSVDGACDTDEVIVCPNCDVSVKTAIYLITTEGLINLWNTRAAVIE